MLNGPGKIGSDGPYLKQGVRARGSTVPGPLLPGSPGSTHLAISGRYPEALAVLNHS